MACSLASELSASHPEPSAAGLTPPTVSPTHPCSTTSTTILQGSMMPATDGQPTNHTGLPVLSNSPGIDAAAAAPSMPSHSNAASDESPTALATTAPRRAQPAPPPARVENKPPSASTGCALPGLPELPLFPPADAAAATAHTPTPSAAALDLSPSEMALVRPGLLPSCPHPAPCEPSGPSSHRCACCACCAMRSHDHLPVPVR
jgi:hypothetical protein